MIFLDCTSEGILVCFGEHHLTLFGTKMKDRERNAVSSSRSSSSRSSSSSTSSSNNSSSSSSRTPSVGVDYGNCPVVWSVTVTSVVGKSNAGVVISATLATPVTGRDDSGDARLPPVSLFSRQTSAACGGHCAICYGWQLRLPSSLYWSPELSCRAFRRLGSGTGGGRQFFAGGKFSVQNIPGYAAILHPSHMAELAQPALSE